MRDALDIAGDPAARAVWDGARRNELALVVVIVITLMLPRDDGLALSVALVEMEASIGRADDRTGAGWLALADEVWRVL